MSAQGQPSASGPQPPRHVRPSKRTSLLRRPSDRVQSWLSGFLLLLLVLGAPAASLTAGIATYHSEMRIARTEAAERHQVTARLTDDAPHAAQRVGGDDLRRAAVHWTDKDGTKHTGTALVAPGTSAGSTVRIWVDREGAVTTSPTPPESALATGALTGLLAGGMAVTVLLGAQAGLRYVLDRRRYSQWDAEWDLVEPLWSDRFRE